MGLEARQIVKSFGTPPQTVLHGLSFHIEAGEFVSIVGRSGSGKTTLLYVLSTLDTPTSGQVLLDGLDPTQMRSRDLHDFRNQSVGFIFQFHYLLPELTALENVLLPARRCGRHQELQGHAMELLSSFGLKDKADRLATKLSGGEQQRVAVARALVMRPKYLFADEPTGNLDTHNSKLVMDFLHQVNREQGTTVILVTHDPDYARKAKRQIYLVDGRLSSSDLSDRL